MKKYNNIEISCYPLEKFNIDRFKIPNWRGSQIANARLFFEIILNQNISNIQQLLYLDADTMIVDDLTNLNNYKILNNDLNLKSIGTNLRKIRKENNYNLIALLDFTFAKAKYSKATNSNCPKINNNKIPQNIIDTTIKSFDIMGHEVNEREINSADYQIDIESQDVGLLDISKIDYMANLGYKITKNYIEKKF